MSQHFIYGLTDPRSGEIRYIGRSSTGMKRPQFHGTPSGLAQRSHKTTWILSLRALGLDYGIKILEEVQNNMLGQAEIRWIALGHERGWLLTNHTDGGEGGGEKIRSEETRQKIRDARLGVKHTAETRIKIGLIGLGRRHTAEAKRKMSLSRKGKKRPPEVGAKISAAKMGHAVSEETRAKLRAANLGKRRNEEKL